jgi:hypothetical protein
MKMDIKISEDDQSEFFIFLKKQTMIDDFLYL